MPINQDNSVCSHSSLSSLRKCDSIDLPDTIDSANKASYSSNVDSCTVSLVLILGRSWFHLQSLILSPWSLGLLYRPSLVRDADFFVYIQKQGRLHCPDSCSIEGCVDTYRSSQCWCN